MVVHRWLSTGATFLNKVVRVGKALEIGVQGLIRYGFNGGGDTR